uniref:Fibrinogen C-terminal domain-containing protein n=1 Tax=Timema douglasi TaxID=61478 RepID=A0A7R8Z4F8_TIMDO|nr:unnamed protein product [Timema douglasi]
MQGYSCVDLLNAGMRDSGVYYLQIRGTTYWFLKVYCEQEVAEGGWTSILEYQPPRHRQTRLDEFDACPVLPTGAKIIKSPPHPPSTSG